MIDLKWLKSTQDLTGSPLLSEKLPVATNIEDGRMVSLSIYVWIHCMDNMVNMSVVMSSIWQTITTNTFCCANATTFSRLLEYRWQQ